MFTAIVEQEDFMKAYTIGFNAGKRVNNKLTFWQWLKGP